MLLPLLSIVKGPHNCLSNRFTVRASLPIEVSDCFGKRTEIFLEIFVSVGFQEICHGHNERKQLFWWVKRLEYLLPNVMLEAQLLELWLLSQQTVADDVCYFLNAWSHMLVLCVFLQQQSFVQHIQKISVFEKYIYTSLGVISQVIEQNEGFNLSVSFFVNDKITYKCQVFVFQRVDEEFMYFQKLWNARKHSWIERWLSFVDEIYAVEKDKLFLVDFWSLDCHLSDLWGVCLWKCQAAGKVVIDDLK